MSFYEELLKKEIEKCKQANSNLYTKEDMEYREWVRREFPTGVPSHTRIESLKIAFNAYKYGKH